MKGISGEMKILCKSGWKYVKDIFDDFENGKQNYVITVNPNDRNDEVYRLVEKIVKHKDVPSVKLTFKDGDDLICTPDFELVTTTLTKIPDSLLNAKDYKSGEEVMVFPDKDGFDWRFYKNKENEVDDIYEIYVDELHTFFVNRYYVYDSSESYK